MGTSPPPSPVPRRLAGAGLLAVYGGRSREAYALDLRQFFAWCAERNPRLFDATAPTSSCTP